MPLPGNVSTGTVTGTLTKTNGNPASGEARFVPNPRQILDASANVILTGIPQVVALDATGSFSIVLVATDDADLNPVDWTWDVFIELDDQPNMAFSMLVPGSVTTNIADAVPVSSSGGELIVRGEQGIQGIQGVSAALTGLYLDGTASNGPSIPDHATLQVTTSLSVRIACALDDITPASLGIIASHGGAAPNLSWNLVVQTNGTISLFLSADGSAQPFILFSTTTAFPTPGALNGIRADYTNVGTDTVTYYRKNLTLANADAEILDDTGWTLISSHTAGVPATLFNTTSALYLGAASTGASPIIGGCTLVAACVKIDGVTQLAPDFRQPVAPRYIDPVARRLWTFNGSAYAWAEAPLV